AVLAALLPAARRRRNAGYGAAAVAAAGEPHGDRQAPRPEAQHAPAPAGRGGGSRNRLHGGPATPAQRSRATAHDDERRALVRTADRARAPPHDDHGAGDAAATAAHRAATAIMGRGARRARPGNPGPGAQRRTRHTAAPAPGADQRTSAVDRIALVRALSPARHRARRSHR